MRVLYRTTPKYYEPAFIDGQLTYPSRITFPFFVGGTPGKDTCQAKCNYCFIPLNSRGSEPHTWKNIDEKIRLEKTQMDDLRFQGFNVVAMIPDSFAWNGKYLESGILNHNQLYDQDELSDMGVAWTSGKPLLKGDAERLLYLAWENDLRLIAATSHGLVDGEAPIKGITQPPIVREFVRLMHAYNKENPERHFKLSLGFPIGTHNIDRLNDYVVYSALLGVDYLRFNRLIDLSNDNRFAHLMLSSTQNRHFFERMKEIQEKNISELLTSASTNVLAYQRHSKVNPDISIMVSTDFGFEGEDVVRLSNPINRCPGGTNLFAIFYELIYPCNELFEFPVGNLSLKGKSYLELQLGIEIPSDRDTIYSPEFNAERIRKLESIVLNHEHKGCIGHTIRTNKIEL